MPDKPQNEMAREPKDPPKDPVTPVAQKRKPAAPVKPAKRFPWQCRTCPNKEDRRKNYRFDSADGKCPKCSEQADRITMVHLLVPDPNGNVKGQYGRFRMVCSPNRNVKGRMHGEAMTASPESVTCPQCREANKS